MPIGERFRKKNLEIQEQIKKEIVKADAGMSNRDKGELRFILTELQSMLEHEGTPLVYPRMIVDSWDYQDKLGEELLELSDLYERLT